MISRRSGWWFAGLSMLTMISAIGCAPAKPEQKSNSIAPKSVNPERDRLKRFWRVFGEATETRIAGDYPGAIELYREALTLDPKHEDSLFYLGQSLKHEGAFTEALTAFERLVEIQPRAKRGFSEIGLLVSSGLPNAPYDLEKARIAFEAAFKMNPEESGSMLHLGELAVARGDEEDALRWLHSVGQTNPREVAAPFLLGYLAYSRGERPLARTQLTAAAARLKVKRGASPSFEGQTSKGAQAMVAEREIAHSLLGPFWTDWARSRDENAAVDEVELDRTYSALGSFLEQLRKGGPESAHRLRPTAR